MSKLNVKEELYCQNVVTGLSKEEAYLKAFGSTDRKRKTLNNLIYLINKKSKIQNRIKELLDERKKNIQAADRDFFKDINYTRKDSFIKLKELRDKAEKGGQIKNAINAENSIIDLLGLAAQRDEEDKELVLKIIRGEKNAKKTNKPRETK